MRFGRSRFYTYEGCWCMQSPESRKQTLDSTQTRTGAFRVVTGHETRGFKLGCTAGGFVFPDLYVLEGSGTLEAVLVTGTALLARTTASGYLDLVSAVGGEVGSTMWRGTCHTAIPFIGWAVANWFSHIQRPVGIIFAKCFHSDFNGTFLRTSNREQCFIINRTLVRVHGVFARSSTRLSRDRLDHALVQSGATSDSKQPGITDLLYSIVQACKKRSVVRGFGAFRKTCVCPLKDRHESARYLGRKNTFEEQETAEIKNRLKAAWAAFHKYGQELTSKTSPMPQITLVQHGDHADIDLRKWNVDIVSDT